MKNGMKKEILPGCVMLFISLVIAVGSLTFLAPCVHEDGNVGACWWAGRSLLGLGCLMAVLSVFALLSARARFGAYLSAVAVCVVGMLTPGTLISLCRMSTMRCRAVMQPAMLILLAAAGLTALLGLLFCRKERKENRENPS